jgi:hypothetical protein
LRIDPATLSLAAIADVAYVHPDEERLRVGAVVAASALAVVLAPVAAIVGLGLLGLPGLPLHRVRRFFCERSGDTIDDEVPRSVDVLRFSATRAWWLCDVQDVPHALVLDAGPDGVVVLGRGWVPQWTRRRALFRRWIVYRGRADGRVLGVRAWGRCPARRHAVDAEDIDVGERVVTSGRAELPVPLSRLLAAGPYR